MIKSARIIAYIAPLLILISAHSVWGRGYTISPIETDPAIRSALQDHYAVNNPWVARRDVLFLFFPGTSSSAANYKLLCETAADLGFHAISLQYVNDVSVNAKCAKSRNLECYENIRREILFGANFSPHVNVSRPNSAENRLVKLLRYLSSQYPLDGWEQYLTAGDVPRWSKILVAGHSQGGSHAAMLGKYYSTAGVVMFASMDYSFQNDKAGSWVYQKSNTRLEKFFAVAHTMDQTMPIDAMRRYWNFFGFRDIAPVINIDDISSPYANSNTLITSIAPAKVDKSKSSYHNVLCMDADTPISKGGKPLLHDLWVYLLNAPLKR
ncbi:MAG: hypothetical protein LBH93_05215 [Chitinispirillales bacterium]|jgi:hypothetical protein|nr:hypothetical protein [Chitinispirillales bacterium]